VFGKFLVGDIKDEKIGDIKGMSCVLSAAVA
jgi:hypothetical protein